MTENVPGSAPTSVPAGTMAPPQVPPELVQTPAWHLLARQVGPPQDCPSFAAWWVIAPVVGLQPSVVQKLPSSTTSGTPGWQTPPRQSSWPLHGLPSEQELFSGWSSQGF